MATLLTKNSSTASSIPTVGQLTAGELALNTTDERLYFKNAAGTVKLLAANVTPVANGGTGVTTSTGTGSTVLSSSPTLTTPTLIGATLAGTVAGGGNQINNVVIGASTPLAGSFTTLSASGDIESTGGAYRINGAQLASKIGTANYIWSGADNLYVVSQDGNTVKANFSSTGLAVTGAISATGALTTAGIKEDSAGNLGLGVVPSAWYVASANARTFQINNASFYADSNNGVSLASNWLFDSAGAQKYLSNGYATRFLQTAGQYQWLTAPSGTAGAAISFTQALTLNANGALVLQGGSTSANGVGVSFPATQSASSDANTLDDYEEGTWNPTLSYGWTVSGTVTATGTYTKIGRQVFITVKIAASGGGSVSMSLANISSLPFAAANATVGGWGVVSNYGATTQTQNVMVDGNVMYFTGSWVGVANYVYTASATYTV